MNYYQNSRCRRNWLHKFKVVSDSSSGTVEVCERCHMRKHYRKDPSGRINNKDFVSHHIRELLQPFNKLFSHEYPNYGKRIK